MKSLRLFELKLIRDPKKTAFCIMIRDLLKRDVCTVSFDDKTEAEEAAIYYLRARKIPVDRAFDTSTERTYLVSRDLETPIIG